MGIVTKNEAVYIGLALGSLYFGGLLAALLGV